MNFIKFTMKKVKPLGMIKLNFSGELNQVTKCLYPAIPSTKPCHLGFNGKKQFKLLSLYYVSQQVDIHVHYSQYHYIVLGCLLYEY